METQTAETADDETGGCSACARAGGLLLLGLAGLLAWMGADLVTGGALTRLVTGGAAAAYAAADVAGSDNGDQEVTASDDPS